MTTIKMQSKHVKCLLGARGMAIAWLAVAASLPLGFAAIVASTNEYAAMGGSGIDCDGPLHVMMFAFPALLVFAPAAIVFALRSSENHRWSDVLGAMLCILLVAAIGSSMFSALRQSGDTDHREACGEGF